MPRSAMAARMASVARCVSPETSRSLRPKIGVGPVNQRDQGCEVSRIGAALLGNDDLMRGINRDLTITAGDETTAAWHDATIAIGEVTLRPVWRCGGLLFVGSKLLARSRHNNPTRAAGLRPQPPRWGPGGKAPGLTPPYSPQPPPARSGSKSRVPSRLVPAHARAFSCRAAAAPIAAHRWRPWPG